MAEQRIEARSQGYAKVFIEERPGYIRNLTDEGCKIVTFSALPSSIGDTVTFQIIPEETASLNRITVDAQLRWEKADGVYFVYGFLITSFASEADKGEYSRLVSMYGRS